MLNRRLLSLVVTARAAIATSAILGVLISVTFVYQSLAVAGVLNRVLDRRGSAVVVVLVVSFAALQVTRFALLRGRERIGTDAANAVKESLRRQLYLKIIRLGPAYTSGERSGMMQTTLIDSVERLDRYIADFLPRTVSSLIASVGVAIAITVLDPLVGAIVIGSALVILVAPLLTRHLVQRSMEAWTVEYRDLYSNSLDAIQGMTTLKAFNAHERREAQLRAQGHRFAKASINLVASSTVHEGAFGAASAVGTTVAVVVGSYQLADHSLGIGALLVLLVLTRECFRPLVELQRSFHMSYSAPSAARQIFEILDLSEPLEDDHGPNETPGPRPGFAFNNVSFRYRAEDRPALSAFDLVVEPGETVALVGRSGSGKTTAVQLLLRFVDPQDGTVTLGGLDLRNIPREEIHRRIALVSQDTYLFHGSVASNLALGRPKATTAQMQTALESANAAEFVSRLPQGLDTAIGERGVKLSGGQRQRLAIARALLADAPVLVLDEATSSVDAANEADIQGAIDLLRAGRTCLIVAHRLSTVRSADRIVVLDGGHVVEQGSADELLETDGAFTRMVAAQNGEQR